MTALLRLEMDALDRTGNPLVQAPAYRSPRSEDAGGIAQLARASLEPSIVFQDTT